MGLGLCAGAGVQGAERTFELSVAAGEGKMPGELVRRFPHLYGCTLLELPQEAQDMVRACRACRQAGRRAVQNAQVCRAMRAWQACWPACMRLNATARWSGSRVLTGQGRRRGGGGLVAFCPTRACIQFRGWKLTRVGMYVVTV